MSYTCQGRGCRRTVAFEVQYCYECEERHARERSEKGDPVGWVDEDEPTQPQR
jgi:hypothetical protein